jgi:hypothetical protein
MLSNRIYEAICGLDLKRTQEIFESACKDYQEKNIAILDAPSIEQQHVPKNLTEANYHREMVDFLSMNLDVMKKKWLGYIVLQKLLDEAISDEVISQLKYDVKEAINKRHTRIQGLKKAIISNQPTEVKALMDIGAKTVRLNMDDASYAGLALSLKNNLCFDVMLSHPAFLFSFESENEVVR